MSQQEPQTPSQDLSQFIELVMKWHFQKISEIDHISRIPESETLEITDEDSGEVHNLEGKEREAFLQGLLVAKSMFMQLPFQPIEVAPLDEA